MTTVISIPWYSVVNVSSHTIPTTKVPLRITAPTKQCARTLQDHTSAFVSMDIKVMTADGVAMTSMNVSRTTPVTQMPLV